MSSITPNLKLFKYDKNVDGSKQFNIDTALNENWEKIDKAFNVTNSDGTTTNIVQSFSNVKELVENTNEDLLSVKKSVSKTQSDVASAEDTLGKHICSTVIHRSIYTGTAEPANGLGIDGDLYIQHE